MLRLASWIRPAGGSPVLERWLADREERFLRHLEGDAQMWDSKIAPRAVLERRRALEWRFGDVPWEDVDLGA